MPGTSDPQIDTEIVKKDLIYGWKDHNRWDMAVAIRRKYYFFRIFAFLPCLICSYGIEKQK